MYKYVTLDPREILAVNNAKVFTDDVYGIEVTIPALAKRCVRNLDPQHSGGDASRTAIEDALLVDLPEDNMTLATVRADLDSVGSMAVFSLRAKGKNLDPALVRVKMVAISDRFARGEYPGPRPLPSRDNPWIEETATAESSRQLAAIAAAVMDFNVPMPDRVATMERWLLTGEEPKKYRTLVERKRLDMIKALETGQIKFKTCAGGRIALVESTHRAATAIGYSLAPVVVAMNPNFWFRQGPKENQYVYRKYTICQFTGKFVDINSALAELNRIEPGWGGSPMIGGSPQGVSSKLAVDEVVEIVTKYLH